MLGEQAAKMALADADAFSQMIDGVVVESALGDQAEGSRHGCRCTVPCGGIGRNFRATPQTRPESGLLSGSRAREEHAVLAVGRGGRANGTTVDSRTADACEEAAVEANVASSHGAVAGVVVEFHDSIIRGVGVED